MTSPASENPAHNSLPPQASRGRIWLLSTIALLLPVFFFLLLEGGLRLFQYGENLDLFILAPKEFSDKEYLVVNPSVGKRYFTKGAYTPQPPYEFMAKLKPANGYRIIVMGESTTAGWPYPNNVMFSRILNQRLSDAFPDKYVEVVNIALSAINSYTLLDYMNEVLAQKPDAILIYTGHNEFYGALGVASTESLGKFRPLVMLYLSLRKLKTVELLENSIAQIRHWLGGLLHGQAAGDAYGTLMGRMIGETNIAYGTAHYDLAKRQFQTNLREIFTEANAANVPIVISEVVSNLRDHPPFLSVSADVGLPADIAYTWAQMLETDGKYELARSAYYWAKDLDALRFRASEDFNEIIHQIAGEFKAPVVPMKAYFEGASPHGLIGFNLMLEHLHPNADGHFIMSEAFFDTLRQKKMIDTNWNEGKIKPAAHYRENWPISAFDRILGDLRIKHLTDHWPFKPLKAPGQAFKNFQPANEVEAIAYRVAKEELGFVNGQLALAKFYESNGQNDDALRQYQALVASSPLDYQVMLAVAHQLLESGRLDQALPFLFASLQIKDTPIANKWIGQVFLNFQKPKQAEGYLEKAVAMQPDDGQAIYALTGAYIMTGQVNKAREALAKLEKFKTKIPAGLPTYDQLQQRLSELEAASQRLP